MAQKRSSRPGSSIPDSTSDSRMEELARWTRENTHLVTIAAVLLVVAIAAGMYYYSFRQDVRLQATEEFERIQQTIVGVGDTETAVTELETFLERFGDTPLAAEARLLLAEAHLHEGAGDQAIGTLEPATQSLNRPISIQAAFLLGSAYEEADRSQDAEELYLRIADQAEYGFQVREALAEAARVRTAAGDHAGAAELYRRLLDRLDEESADELAGAAASQRAVYELRLAEAEARANR